MAFEMQGYGYVIRIIPSSSCEGDYWEQEYLIRHTSWLLLKPQPHARTPPWTWQDDGGRVGIQTPVCYSSQYNYIQEIFLYFSKKGHYCRVMVVSVW